MERATSHAIQSTVDELIGYVVVTKTIDLGSILRWAMSDEFKDQFSRLAMPVDQARVTILYATAYRLSKLAELRARTRRGGKGRTEGLIAQVQLAMAEIDARNGVSMQPPVEDWLDRMSEISRTSKQDARSFAGNAELAPIRISNGLGSRLNRRTDRPPTVV